MFSRPSKSYDVTEKNVEAVLHDDANPLYHIAKIIPPNAKVLDIGAGNGLLARVLAAARRGVTIDGIEPSPYAASFAKDFYRDFHTGYAHEYISQIREERYDFIVLADVIEHMADPLAMLDELSSALSDQGRIIVTTPNIAFGAVRVAMLRGQFDYVDSGILERTHLRFFTLKTLEALISETRLNIEKLYLLQRDLFQSEIKLRPFSVNPWLLCKLYRDPLARTYQFLVLLSKHERPVEKRAFGNVSRYSLMPRCVLGFLRNMLRHNY